mgnify:CR=1 FL=1
MATRRRRYTKRKHRKRRYTRRTKKYRKRRYTRKYRKRRYRMNSDDKIKELDIQYYSSTNCGYCVESNYMLKKAGVMKYIKKYVNKPSPDKQGAVPYFYSKKTKKSYTGYPRTINNLIEKLS